jgi:hypothetical protein
MEHGGVMRVVAALAIVAAEPCGGGSPTRSLDVGECPELGDETRRNPACIPLQECCTEDGRDCWIQVELFRVAPGVRCDEGTCRWIVEPDDAPIVDAATSRRERRREEARRRFEERHVELQLAFIASLAPECER